MKRMYVTTDKNKTKKKINVCIFKMFENDTVWMNNYYKYIKNHIFQNIITYNAKEKLVLKTVYTTRI